ncbi:helix-turn-helix domain-containing protein [Thauera sinica]
MLERYRTEAGLSIDRLAQKLMLPPPRVADLLDGRAILGNEIATHVEEMLGLPSSWLDDCHEAAAPVRPPPGHTPPRTLSTVSPRTAEDVENGTSQDTQDMDTDIEPPNLAGKRNRGQNKQQIGEQRRQNLVMLTARRGSKNRLAQLAGTSGSRISLMTSARKPVSDPFSQAIEDGLGLPRNWLDTPHTPDDVPPQVWSLLEFEPAGNGLASSMPPRGRDAISRLRKTMAESLSRTASVAGSASREGSSGNTDGPQMAPMPEEKPAGILSPAPEAGFVRLPDHPEIFDKEPGKIGAIAEALAKTILHLSETDRLSETRAFQILGLLMTGEGQR